MSIGSPIKRSDAVVYIDMDHVLTDFNKAVYRIGTAGDSESFDDYRYNPRIDYVKNLYGTMDKFFSTDGMDVGFWQYMPLEPDADLFISLIKCKRCHILTAPGGGLSFSPSLEGKAKWLERFLPRFTACDITITRQKAMFAGEGSILIDDNASFCREFAASCKTVKVYKWPTFYNSSIKYANFLRHKRKKVIDGICKNRKIPHSDYSGEVISSPHSGALFGER